ncbi:PREDICTED: acyl-CoA-binding domain-containing protein 6 [Polistes dominula]|uniref:Acyl-CoA-binding domain-containing protein 6 n=1 Tax=Polistes dominula TaxID=743375 RepID=A0ABM1JD31_POLDO|nr:PREDICTED: acyl-CoA-binding domain-containing protein 6 [Polistes dominula]
MAENNDFDVTNTEKKFDKAAKYVQTIASELDSEQLLNLYSLYKQATIGPCNIPKPNWYQMQAKQKWVAWNSLGEMDQETAMNNYVCALAKINPSWETDAVTESRAWITVSRLPNTEKELLDTDKTFLDWIKEGNQEKVREILLKNSTLTNVLDKDGLLPIHWAADRGHVAIIEYLIQHGANINSRDIDGQTPLHYAASCGHVDVVEYLISMGAESVEDNDGMKPKDVADEKVLAIL